jgi:hypothetical protein
MPLRTHRCYRHADLSTDPNEMTQQAKALGQATAELINSINGEAAEHEDLEI